MLLNSAVRATPGDLPGMFAQLLQIMQKQADDISELRRVLATPAEGSPDAVGEWVPIPAAGWYPGTQAQVVRILVTSDTSDLFTFQRGNDTQSFQFGLTSYVPRMFDLSGPARLYVTTGLPLKVVQVTAGSAQIWAFACYIPGDNPGRASK